MREIVSGQLVSFYNNFLGFVLFHPVEKTVPPTLDINLAHEGILCVMRTMMIQSTNVDIQLQGCEAIDKLTRNG